MLPPVLNQRHTLLFPSCPQNMYYRAGKCRDSPASQFKGLQPCKSVALMCFISTLKIISSTVSLSKWKYLFREAKMHHSIWREPGKSTFTVLIPCWNPQGLPFPVPSSRAGGISFSSTVKDWVTWRSVYFFMHLFPFPSVDTLISFQQARSNHLFT